MIPTTSYGLIFLVTSQTCQWERHREFWINQRQNAFYWQYTYIHTNIYKMNHTKDSLALHLSGGRCSVIKLCLTLCDPMDWNPPGSSVHKISQARILEWVAISFSKGSSWPRDWTCVSCIGRRILHCWATREVHLSGYWAVVLNWERGEILHLPQELPWWLRR